MRYGAIRQGDAMRAPILPCHCLPSLNLDPGHPIRLSRNYRGGNPTVSRAGGRFGFNLSLRIDFGTTGAIQSGFSKSNSKHPNQNLSDVCTTLRSTARGLSAVLKYYDVWYACSTKPFTPLTFEPANGGESWNNRIINTPGRRACRITKHSCSRGRGQGDKEKAGAQRVIHSLSRERPGPHVRFQGN